MPDLCPVCPAARHVAGATPALEGIVCGVLLREGLIADGITEGEANEYMALGTDPSMIYGFCCGTAIPAATVEQAKGDARANYTYCSIWQQEKERIWDEKRRAWGEREAPVLDPITGADLLARIS